MALALEQVLDAQKALYEILDLPKIRLNTTLRILAQERLLRATDLLRKLHSSLERKENIHVIPRDVELTLTRIEELADAAGITEDEDLGREFRPRIRPTLVIVERLRDNLLDELREVNLNELP